MLGPEELNELNELDELDELDNLFGGESLAEQSEKVILTQNLEGFAHCFPEWDLHPPVDG